MDFLTLFAIYVVVVLACIALVCKYSGQQQTPFGLLLNSVTRVLSPWTPKWLRRLFQRTLHRLFHQRNNMFIYLHLLLEGAAYTEFSYEVFGYCRDMGTTLTSLAAPYVFLVVKSIFFYLCIRRDPGTVTRRKHAVQLQVYPYDGMMFLPGVSCPTCQLVKPARSKHCRVCNRCVQRFDHHCVWVNNCVGAQNTRYFLMYLLSVCGMAGSMAVLTGDMLLQAVLRSGLLRAHYLDQQGQHQQAGTAFIIQHLFLTFPRIVFMLGFLVFVCFLLASYFLFHSYLALVNQTSNEWYKLRGSACQHCHPTVPNHLCGPPPEHSTRFFYSRGVVKNLWEILSPFRPTHKKNN
ncbi:palmitoyltransferase ZDHHC4 [Osmerus mordax]|uniref:palmitoyltransferase ZDHHC4 n=1 Tax=Osmerus mordax TaxID=8014 RepID=UPI0035101000